MDIEYLLLLQNFRVAIGGALNGFMEFVTKLATRSWCRCCWAWSTGAWIRTRASIWR